MFPDDLAEQFDRVRGETGIHHIYKFVLRPLVHVNGNGSRNANGNGMPARVPTLSAKRREHRHRAAGLEGQEQIGRLIIFDDVTDRAELEHRLVQADKLSRIGLLAAGVAHEVNTPLAVISTYAQMLAKQVADDDQKADAAREDRQADFPRQRDRQLPAEFLADLHHRLRAM